MLRDVVEVNLQVLALQVLVVELFQVLVLGLLEEPEAALVFNQFHIAITINLVVIIVSRFDLIVLIRKLFGLDPSQLLFVEFDVPSALDVFRFAEKAEVAFKLLIVVRFREIIFGEHVFDVATNSLSGGDLHIFGQVHLLLSICNVILNVILFFHFSLVYFL